MARIILLDAGPIGLACSRPGVPPIDRCLTWLTMLETSGARILLPAVAVYEVRRELLRLGATAKLRRLQDLDARFGHLDVSGIAWERAAEFWALVRRTGRPTATEEDLDGDAILAGQAATVGDPGDLVTVATANVRHLGRFPGVDARSWDAVLA